MVVCQVGKGDRGDVTILPTIVINQRQYRGGCDLSTCILDIVMTNAMHVSGNEPRKFVILIV
jgi:hypothetical protein